jgi:hypothetical protein
MNVRTARLCARLTDLVHIADVALAQAVYLQRLTDEVRERADAAIIMGRSGESADEPIQKMLDMGWTLDPIETYVGTTRVRVLRSPEGV